MAHEVSQLPRPSLDEPLTIYFGGGTPACVSLRPVLSALVRWWSRPPDEFTVELHPLDAMGDVPLMLRDSGVNRISIGFQSLDDYALASMGRCHDARQAISAFEHVRTAGFGNIGIDLIAGWPGTDCDSWLRTLAKVCDLAPTHVSVYTLIREPGTRIDRDVELGLLELPDDSIALEQYYAARDVFSAAGLLRYEFANFAIPVLECRHNMAVWNGEDYIGIGDGAHGRVGLSRTNGVAGRYRTEYVSAFEDARERALFALRTSGGLDICSAVRRWPALSPVVHSWSERMEGLVAEGLVLMSAAGRYKLTDRGFEVCDAVIAELF